MADKVLAPRPKFQALDSNGDPLASGTLDAFVAGTSTRKDTFDAQNGSANANPVVLDARGEADVWFEAGSYKLVLKDSAAATIWTVDNIDSNISTFQRFDTIAALLATDGDANTITIVSGFAAAGDGGGGTFYYDVGGSATDDGGIVRDSDSGDGQWVRLLDDTSALNPRWWGAKGDGSTDDRTNVNKVITYVNVSGQEYDILFEKGTFKFSSALTFPSDINLRFSGDGKFSADSLVTITINSGIDQTATSIFSGAGSFVFGEGSTDHIYANWFGATGDGSTDDLTEIQAAIDNAVLSSEVKTVKLRPGVYSISASLQITTDNIELLGAGPLATQIKHIVNSDNALDLSTGTTVDFAAIRNIGFQSNGTATNTAIGTNDCAGLEIENVYISGFQDGIAFATAIDTNISNVRTTNIQRYGMSFDSATVRANVNNCVLDSDKGSGTSALFINGAEGIVCSGISINDQAHGVTVEANSSLFFTGSINDCLTAAFLLNGGSTCVSSLFTDDPGADAVFKSTAANDLSVLHTHILTTTASPTITFSLTGGPYTWNVFVGALTSDDSTLIPDGANYNDSVTTKIISFKGTSMFWGGGLHEQNLTFEDGAITFDQNEASASANFAISLPASETTGDAYFRTGIDSGVLWSWGLDNSDSDKWVLSDNVTPGTNNAIEVTPSTQAINFPGDASTDGDLHVNVAGKGILLKEGSNAVMGGGTLSGGTVTISTTAVLTASRIFLTNTLNANALKADTITDATSFVVTGTTSDTFNWLIINPT